MKTTQLTIDDVKKMFSGLNIITIFTQFFGYSTKRTVYSKGYEVNDRNNLCVCLCKEYKGDFYTWFHIPGCTTCSDSSTLMNTDTMRALLVRRYFYMWVDAENAAEREVHCSKCNAVVYATEDRAGNCPYCARLEEEAALRGEMVDDGWG